MLLLPSLVAVQGPRSWWLPERVARVARVQRVREGAEPSLSSGPPT
jgi:hypothetical protein